MVTAQKRSEALRDVPQSVTAIPEKTLERQGVDNFSDFAGLVPGMQLESVQPGSTRIVLRGINAGGVGYTIGAYLDETPYGSSSALANGAITTPDIDTFDIQRIEVLRGPQGTLYGAGTLGGLLKFVTYAPNPAGFESKVLVGAETVESGDVGWTAKGMINVPLGDNIAFRGNAYRRVDAGYIDDPTRGLEDINETDVTGFRGSLLWEASDDISIRLTAVAQDMNSDAANAQDLVLATPFTLAVPYRTLRGDLTQARGINPINDVEYRLYNATADWDFGWAALTSVTSFGTFAQSALADFTLAFAGNLSQRLDQDKFVEEVRLTSPASDTFEWLIGFFYTHETASLHQEIVSGPFATGFVHLDSEFDEMAGFVNATYHFSPRFDISAGARYSTNDQNSNQFGFLLFTGPIPGSSSEDVFTYAIAPRWRVSDNAMIYARVATGYRPGGPNALPPAAPPGIETFDSDSLINYEAGIKADVSDRLSLDVSVFFIEWSGIQLLTQVGGFGINGNGGSAESMGLEWTITYVPVDGLTLLFDGAYTDAQLTSDTDPIVGAVAGDPLPFAAKWSTMLSADYEWAAFGDATAFVGLSWRYVGDRHGNFTEGFGGFGLMELPSYHTVDLRAGADFGHWSLQLFAKNVADERGFVAFQANLSVLGGSLGATGISAAVIQPRTIGITATARF